MTDEKLNFLLCYSVYFAVSVFFFFYFILILPKDLQIRDFRTDWDLQVNQPVAGNYYPVCFFNTVHDLFIYSSSICYYILL